MSGILKTEDGLTIVELIVAMIVGTILLGSVNVIYMNQVYLSQNARDRSQANAYAEGKIESLRSAGYLQVNNGVTDITSELPTELNPPRNASMTVTNQSNGMKKVVIAISYNSQGKNLQETYTTYVGELGAGQ